MTNKVGKRWILNSPYEEPSRYWDLDIWGRATEDEKEGRRESSARVPVPNAAAEEVRTDIEPHATINQLRQQVQKWRNLGYPGSSSISRDLLEFFADDDLEQRPFFCQRECLETLIWLLEAGRSQNDPETSAWRNSYEHTEHESRKWNDGIFRLAFKMATGTGKTKVMAMMLAWLVLVRKVENVLLITPNLTIKDQLHKLAEDTRKIVPDKYRDGISRLKLTVMNFQAFVPREQFGFRDPPSKGFRLAVGADTEEILEEPQEMLDRLVDGFRTQKKFVVINDEAHHCRFTPKMAKERSEGNRDRKDRMLWAQTIKHLHSLDLLDMVLDLSATPMYLDKQKGMDSVLFPWTITDFPLLEAIESGLVKIPRLPMLDNVSGDVARHVYRHTDDKNLRCTELPNALRQLLTSLAEHHEREAKDPWINDRNVEPVLIVVANTIANAYELYKWIAGYERNGKWVQGNLRQFSNVCSNKLEPKENPPTMLIASQLEDLVVTNKNVEDTILEQQIKVHARNLEGTRSSKATFKARLREMFRTVGKKHMPGEKIQCVISVSMLTEGWDCRNVTSIFGFREFGSSLLCEQVVGRSLRRTEHWIQEDGMLTECYADILGVPFDFLTPRESPLISKNELIEVQSIPDRFEEYNIDFPCLIGYKYEVKQVGSIELSLKNIREFAPGATCIDDIELSGAIGETANLSIDHTSPNTAIWNIASLCTERYMRDWYKTERRPQLMPKKQEVFRQFVEVVKEWSSHPMVTLDPDSVSLNTQSPNQYTQAAVNEIFNAIALSTMDWSISLTAILDKDVPTRSTRNIFYWSAKSHRHTTKSSEIDIAACDSSSEVECARILDSHTAIKRWARNERLGFNVPWYDEQTLRWRKYEPDFIAQAKNADGETVNLIIEFKGVEDRVAIKKRQFTEENWIPAVSKIPEWSERGDWRYLYLTDRDPAYIHRQIAGILT